MTIFLCGFMGCGKTTVGRELSRLLSYKFYDLDELIEQTEGRTIPQIFSESGEKYFRDLETKAIKGFEGNNVVALGGGAILRKENALAANSQGVTVYIKTDFDTCYKRISGDENRPLAATASYDELLARYNSRTPVYEGASKVVVSGDEPPLALAKTIASQVAILR